MSAVAIADVEREVSRRLDRVEALEPRLQALVPEEGRRQRLMREVGSLDPDGPPGPLHGVLAGVKDILHADGFATRAGTQLPPELFAGSGDAECVAALRRAGALVLGKTVTTEFAYFEPGPTRNPHFPEHTPGGSSSGSAAAVAAGYCPLALGTQTVGSVIRPAAFCGVVGFKPSYGRVPTAGLLLCSPSVDTIGLLAQDAATAAAGAAVLVSGWGADRALAAANGARPALGVPRGRYLEQASAEGLTAFARQVEVLAAAGYRVEEVEVLDDIADIGARHGDLQAGEMARVHADWFDRYRALYRPRTRQLLERGRDISEERLEEARAGRDRLRAQLHEAMRRAGIDLWICPSAPGPAPRGLESTGNPAMNLPWTHAGLPALSLPAGRCGRLPLGLQCVAAYGRDEALLVGSAGLAAALRPLAPPAPRLDGM